MKKLLKKIGKGILYLLILFVLFILLALLVIGLNSSEHPEPVLNAEGNKPPNSIALITDTVINGASQRLTIRGHDVSKPVLLRVHGGPGAFHMPQFYRAAGNDLEEYFTVCYWDQRGSGPAYVESLPDSEIRLENIVNDGIAVADHLRQKFGKDKIYLEGISWGTVVSAFMVKKNPEAFIAYIGVAQMADQLNNEILSYEYVLDEANHRKDTLAITALEELGAPPYSSKKEATAAIPVQRKYATRYAPDNMTFTTIELMKLILLYEGWSMNFKFHIITEGEYGISAPILWNETMVDLNLIEMISDWPIPVHFIHGELDHMAETSVSKAYFDSITAPRKKFYLFEDIGHFASAENPEKYTEIMLKEVRNLTD